ncbi:hypothetical protein EWM64_g9276 [Hericium alpestre]|uniref:DUF659 domain-containing protein n=1 Tax=Hericium alpestre TaxID=135208 RepID=A0A4Y9ZIW4_9AGAM|nr:hypothetical protein EWM64_g9276 [Hericium alpestre]
MCLAMKVGLDTAAKLADSVLGQAPSEASIADDVDGDDSSKKSKSLTSSGTVRAVKRKVPETMDITSYLDRPMKEEDIDKANLLLLRRDLVFTNTPFSRPESPFFRKFTSVLRPTYPVPSRYMLIQKYLPGEEANVHLDDVKRLSSERDFTVLTDGWEDLLKRSVYGTLLAQVSEFPVVLGLKNLSGERNTADKILETVDDALTKKDVLASKVLAVCTDNPTTMRAFRRKFSEKYPWVITTYCFMHGINTIIRKITTFPAMKTVVSKNARIVSFFRGSHYWGGQLKEKAASMGIKRGLKTNTETRFYALILQALSVQEHRRALADICLHDDAMRSINGMSPVRREVITIVMDPQHWTYNDQLIRTCKPLVDIIGNIESRDATLADCMLELIGAHRWSGGRRTQSRVSQG